MLLFISLLFFFTFFFFFNDTATTEIYTLSLHDALPISRPLRPGILTSSTRQVGPSGGSTLRKSETDENCWVSRQTVRRRRATESRNSGSSSMTKTLGFASPIPGIPKAARSSRYGFYNTHNRLI